MLVTRRMLSGLALVTPATIALGAVGTPPALAAGGRFVRTTWQPLTGRTFVLEQGDVRRRAVLSAVADLSGAPRGALQRFSLVFSAEHDLPEGAVLVRRPGFRARLFVTRVDRGVVAQHRQAIINRI